MNNMENRYTKLFNEVKKEAMLLRQYATQNELSKLDFNKLDSQNVSNCIYGQMTGNCFNERAKQLIEECVLKAYKPNVTRNKVYHSIYSPKINPLSTERSNCTSYFTPIEIFIDLPNNFINIDKLIQFLKYGIDLEFLEYELNTIQQLEEDILLK